MNTGKIVVRTDYWKENPKETSYHLEEVVNGVDLVIVEDGVEKERISVSRTNIFRVYLSSDATQVVFDSNSKLDHSTNYFEFKELKEKAKRWDNLKELFGLILERGR